MSNAEVLSFFETYRDAFDRLDGDAVADLWHTPSAITDTRSGGASAQVTGWSEDAQVRENHRALCDIYRAQGYRSASFEIVDNVGLGAHHAFAHVHWSLWRHDGSLLQDFHTGYNLLRTPSGPKVLLVTAYQEDIGRMRRDAAP